MDRIEFGRRVKFFRVSKRNMSQEIFSNVTGIERTYLCKIESGQKNPTLDTINKICYGLGISIQDFFNEDITNGVQNEIKSI